MTTYDYRALIRAYIDNRRCSKSPNENGGYYTDLFRTLTNLFDIHFDVRREFRNEFTALVESDLDAALKWRKTAAEAIFYQTVERFISMEATHSAPDLPGGNTELWRKYGTRVDKAYGDLKLAYERLLDDMFMVMYGRVNQTFSSEDLKRLGFDDSNPPA